ncbi:MAG: hypothetical protein ACI8X5_001457 [Planctomycetota bacterium]|jgi:hypothetical protein
MGESEIDDAIPIDVADRYQGSTDPVYVVKAKMRSGRNRKEECQDVHRVI